MKTRNILLFIVLLGCTPANNLKVKTVLLPDSWAKYFVCLTFLSFIYLFASFCTYWWKTFLVFRKQCESATAHLRFSDSQQRNTVFVLVRSYFKIIATKTGMFSDSLLFFFNRAFYVWITKHFANTHSVLAAPWRGRCISTVLQRVVKHPRAVQNSAWCLAMPQWQTWARSFF